MSKLDIYDMLFESMKETWKRGYDKPDHAIAFIDEMFVMAQKMIEKIDKNEN